MTTPKPETIERAAIRHDGVVYSVPRPVRHHHVIALMAERPEHCASHCSPDKQGFVTSAGRFVGRREGMRIAEDSGQLIAAPHVIGMLFSEDVW